MLSENHSAAARHAATWANIAAAEVSRSHGQASAPLSVGTDVLLSPFFPAPLRQLPSGLKYRHSPVRYSYDAALDRIKKDVLNFQQCSATGQVRVLAIRSPGVYRDTDSYEARSIPISSWRRSPLRHHPSLLNGPGLDHSECGFALPLDAVSVLIVPVREDPIVARARLGALTVASECVLVAVGMPALVEQWATPVGCEWISCDKNKTDVWMRGNDNTDALMGAFAKLIGDRDNEVRATLVTEAPLQRHTASNARVWVEARDALDTAILIMEMRSLHLKAGQSRVFVVPVAKENTHRVWMAALALTLIAPTYLTVTDTFRRGQKPDITLNDAITMVAGVMRLVAPNDHTHVKPASLLLPLQTMLRCIHSRNNDSWKLQREEYKRGHVRYPAEPIADYCFCQLPRAIRQAESVFWPRADGSRDVCTMGPKPIPKDREVVDLSVDDDDGEYEKVPALPVKAEPLSPQLDSPSLEATSWMAMMQANSSSIPPSPALGFSNTVSRAATPDMAMFFPPLDPITEADSLRSPPPAMQHSPPLQEEEEEGKQSAPIPICAELDAERMEAALEHFVRARERQRAVQEARREAEAARQNAEDSMRRVTLERQQMMEQARLIEEETAHMEAETRRMQEEAQRVAEQVRRWDEIKKKGL
jgi:hypothetical protein